MITDRETRLSNAQAVTTGTQYSDYAYDTGTNDADESGELWLVVSVGTAFTGGTSLQVNFVDSANSNLTSPTLLITGAVIAEASLTAGARIIRRKIPSNTQKYIGLQFVTVGTHTAGTINANIVRDSDTAAAFLTNETGY